MKTLSLSLDIGQLLENFTEKTNEKDQESERTGQCAVDSSGTCLVNYLYKRECYVMSWHLPVTRRYLTDRQREEFLVLITLLFISGR